MTRIQKRLTLELEPKLHQQFKIYAVKQKVTMSKLLRNYVKQILGGKHT